jgi:uncharacterized secreted protein with C-terminal beta-propeller domain
MTTRTLRTLHLTSLLAVAALAVAACSSDDSATPGSGSTGGSDTTGGGGSGRVTRAYESFDDCDAFLDWTKARLLERVTPYGIDGGYWYGVEDVMAAEAPAATEAPAGVDDRSTEAGAADGGTSTTNTQELGVDEGDLTETDGRFVYSVIDHRLRSVDLDTATLLSEIDVPQGEHQMILSGDRLLLVTQRWDTSGSPDTAAAVYTVTDGVLELQSTTHLEGMVLATRSIDGHARLALNQSIVSRIPFVYPRTGTEESEEAALEENKRVIDELTADDLLPRRYDEGANGTIGAVTTAVDCSQVGHPGDFSGFGMVWVAALDLGASEPAVEGAAALVADSQTVYASKGTLYVGTVRYQDLTGDTVPVNPEPPHTDLHAFDLSAPSGAAYLASGEVEGTVLNQYSLSEHEGFLRVATTTQGGGFGEDQQSGVHVFERDGGELVEVGAVRGLGRGEQIQGVRFFGDQGYVVTFRQVDPLFVLDLSDPENPQLTGELKVPGYSTYLHPLGDGRLVAVGMSGDDAGRITGTQLSLFDVSDPASPTLLDTLPITETFAEGSSEATYDPHAFLWWPDSATVVVPQDLICEGARERAAKGCESAVVVTVGADTLDEQGGIFHWFPIRRSMVAEGRLVTVSAGGVRVHDLTTLDQTGDIRFDVPGTTADDDLP